MVHSPQISLSTWGEDTEAPSVEAVEVLRRAQGWKVVLSKSQRHAEHWCAQLQSVRSFADDQLQWGHFWELSISQLWLGSLEAELMPSF